MGNRDNILERLRAHFAGQKEKKKPKIIRKIISKNAYSEILNYFWLDSYKYMF
jgi:hypothetical protein